MYAYWAAAAVVDRAYSLHDGVGVLPMCQELAASTGKEQKHMFTQLELPGLSRMLVGTALFSLGHLQMFLNGGHDFVNLGLHDWYIINDRLIGQ